MSKHGNRRVVITGLGAVTPVGIGAQATWESMLAGRSGTGKITKFDASAFSSTIAAELPAFDPSDWVPKGELRRMDQFVVYAAVAAEMALRDSQLDLEKIDLDLAGVIIGSGIGGLATLENETANLLNKGPRRVSPLLIPMMIVNMASGVVGIRYKFRGPNTSVVTACATGNHCVGDAFRLIQYGDADLILAGGTEAAITPIGLGGFCSLRALSTRNDEPESASRPFDATRDGFVMGEGAGVVLLEALEHAVRRNAPIHAELVGFGMSADAHHLTQPLPDGAGIRRAMENALRDAGHTADEVDYINAHGTSTPFNDKTETAAIKALCGDHARNGLVVSSTKSMTGHALGAAGGIELVAAVKAVEDGKIPPTINYGTPDPECDLDYCPNTAREKTINLMLSNSMGFGGQNAVLAIKPYKE